jgi:RNA polymerase sigma-70 factor (ECF subfamily)
LLEVFAEEGLDDLERQEAERRALGYCLERLPASDRELLHDYYSHQASVPELASRQGRTIAAVYKLMSRIRAALLRCIEGRLAAEGYR